MQLRNRETHNQSIVTRSMRYVDDIKFGMLQARENDISLRKWNIALGAPGYTSGS